MWRMSTSMNEALQQVKQELEECGLSTYLVPGVAEDIIAFKYTVPTGRYRGKCVDIGLSMQEANYPEYPPHWIHITPMIEDRRGRHGKEYQDSAGRHWGAFSRPPSDFWDTAPTKHMSVYLQDHLRRFWRYA